MAWSVTKWTCACSNFYCKCLFLPSIKYPCLTQWYQLPVIKEIAKDSDVSIGGLITFSPWHLSLAKHSYHSVCTVSLVTDQLTSLNVDGTCTTPPTKWYCMWGEGCMYYFDRNNGVLLWLTQLEECRLYWFNWQFVLCVSMCVCVCVCVCVCICVWGQYVGSIIEYILFASHHEMYFEFQFMWRNHLGSDYIEHEHICILI